MGTGALSAPVSKMLLTASGSWQVGFHRPYADLVMSRKCHFYLLAE